MAAEPPFTPTKTFFSRVKTMGAGGVMKVEVTAAQFYEKAVLRNLMELYQYDFSEMEGEDVNDFGLFGYRYLDHYWTDPGRFPFLIRVDGKLAGFALVRRGRYLPEKHPLPQAIPLMMAEFFVMRKYRRQGVGALAAKELFSRFTGRWEVGQIAQNPAAQAFWRKVIGEYTGGRYEEVFHDAEGWRGPVQTFHSGKET
jgi:predicted acetyltransferase